MEETTENQLTTKSFDPASVNKLQFEFIEEEDGSGTILIEWDENDPELLWWSAMTEDEQQQFIINALETALEPYKNELENVS